MALTTLYPTKTGIDRLLAAMLDVREAHPAWSGTDVPLSAASQGFNELFQGYRQLLQAVYNVASPWWEGTIEAQISLGMDRPAAIEVSFEKRLAGPASHPNVVWIVRSFWLACAMLNARGDQGAYVRPEVVLLQWLIDSGETELVRLIACMPHWPVGLDENGEWC